VSIAGAKLVTQSSATKIDVDSFSIIQVMLAIFSGQKTTRAVTRDEHRLRCSHAVCNKLETKQRNHCVLLIPERAAAERGPMVSPFPVLLLMFFVTQFLSPPATGYLVLHAE